MSDLDFSAKLQETADAVTIVLDALIPPVQGPESELLSAMRYSALGGGKRMRPYLLLSTGRIFGVDKRLLLRAAAALECVHCYSLIHDDLPCMDDDDMRRGAPTVHKAYDEATAVLAGDALLTLAFEILSDAGTHQDPHIRIELVSGLSKAAGALGMVGGQAMDMSGSLLSNDMAAVTRMQRLKTGALFNFAVDAACIMGRASSDARSALHAYAHDFGLAFQITDDILDIEGNAQTAGKAVNKDDDHGKATFVSLLGLENAKSRVGLLCDQAKGHLKLFGDNANDLRELVDKIIDRQS